MVQMIGRGEMHHVNVGVCKHFIERAVAARDAKFGRFLLRRFLALLRKTQNLNAVAPQTFDVSGPDKTRTSHTNANGLFRQFFICHMKPPSKLQASHQIWLRLFCLPAMP